jgi:hypothetical protein
MEKLRIPPEFWVYPRPLYVLERLEARLRADERVFKSVVFIGAENERGFTPYGTAAVGAARYEDEAFIQLITAKHVIDQIPGQNVFVRVNKFDGTSKCFAVDKRAVMKIDQTGLDIAVIPCQLDPTIYDFFVIKMMKSDLQQAIEKHGSPGLGDEVCVVGLYTTHYGHTKNLPVVRVGHIAALPEEPLMTNRGYVHGWLIECFSIAGLSGSPVFWNVPQMRLVDGKPVFSERAYVPLGILIGYHLIESKEDEIAVPQYQTPQEERTWAEMAEPSKMEQRRTGFAVMIPLYLLYHIFESKEIQELFQKAIDLRRQMSGYKPASASPPGFDASEGPRGPTT